MSTASLQQPTQPTSWFGRTEHWLDERGKGAWIAAMVLGFIFFWPIGLALLAYMIWSKRMFSKSTCATAVTVMCGRLRATPLLTLQGRHAAPP